MGIIAGTGYLKVDPSTVGASFWLAAKYSEKWLTDAIIETKKKQSPDTIRREIVFAVCFVESYLVEWVCTLVDLNEVASYFPEDERGGIKERWQSIIKKLRKGNIIDSGPNLKTSVVWPEFRNLVKFRDSLVHAGAYLPGSTGQPDRENPAPSPDDLMKVDSGWASGVAIALVRELHEASSTSLLPWLEKY